MAAEPGGSPRGRRQDEEGYPSGHLHGADELASCNFKPVGGATLSQHSHLGPRALPTTRLMGRGP